METSFVSAGWGVLEERVGWKGRGGWEERKKRKSYIGWPLPIFFVPGVGDFARRHQLRKRRRRYEMASCSAVWGLVEVCGDSGSGGAKINRQTGIMRVKERRSSRWVFKQWALLAEPDLTQPLPEAANDEGNRHRLAPWDVRCCRCRGGAKSRSGRTREVG